MVVSMDLNVSPLPEDEEESFDAHRQDYNGPVERHETAVEIAHREREERRKRMKVDRSDSRPVHVPRQHDKDNFSSNRPFRTYDISKIPPGWLDCPNAGQEIGDVLVPSKVPLSDSFNECIPPGKRYSFKQVIHQQKVAGRKLGLVIDLTNTTRYYSPAEFKKEGIKHVKIQCRGRGEAPENTAVNQFVYEVSLFVTSQRQPKKYILVHCTHGHNRTGYMIVHYLMRTRPISVTEAINMFADVRPPGIYKSDYIDALYAFYHERKPDMIVCPPTPEWKRSSELDLNGEAVPDEDDDGGAPAPLHDNHETDAKMTIDDTLGDKIPDDQRDLLRSYCYQLLKLNPPVGRNLQFPGSHPVSLTRKKLQLLRQRYYYATWKADGTRYMMLIMADGCYLIDRSFNFHRVQMRFPCRGTNEVLAKKTHHVTLLDGEMIIDTLPDSNKQERRYLIYDLMAYNSVSVAEVGFKLRFMTSLTMILLSPFLFILYAILPLIQTKVLGYGKLRGLFPKCLCLLIQKNYLFSMKIAGIKDHLAQDF